MAPAGQILVDDEPDDRRPYTTTTQPEKSFQCTEVPPPMTQEQFGIRSHPFNFSSAEVRRFGYNMSSYSVESTASSATNGGISAQSKQLDIDSMNEEESAEIRCYVMFQ